MQFTAVFATGIEGLAPFSSSFPSRYASAESYWSKTTETAKPSVPEVATSNKHVRASGKVYPGTGSIGAAAA